MHQVPDGEDQASDINSSPEHLSSLGLLNSHLSGMLKGGISWGDVTAYTISGYGSEFIEYCLSRGGKIHEGQDEDTP